MKEIIVKRDIMGNYTGIDIVSAYNLVMNGTYDFVGFESDDRIIQILFPTLGFKADDEKKVEELKKYFEYVQSITGIEAPEVIDS